MKLINPCLFAALLLTHSISFAANEDPNASLVKQTITKLMQENHIPGVAVEMYVDGKPYSYYFGEASEKKKTPVTKNTIFEVGSFTKLMTSLLLAQEVDIAKMKLSDSIRKYDPELPEGFNDVTLLHLATHTGGLPFKQPNEITKRSEVTQYLLAYRPFAPAGSNYQYSNLGIGLLGEALEKATNTDYAKLYIAHIANPLKMQPIVFDVPTKYKKFVAEGHDKEGNVVEPNESGLFPSAGGLRISANDIQHFLSAAIGLPGTPERILYPMRLTQAAHFILPEQAQGLGWQIHAIQASDIPVLLNEPEEMNLGPIKAEKGDEQAKYNPNTLIDKTGATAGFRSYIAVIPGKKSGIVILTNKYISNGSIVKAGREILFKAAKLG